MTDMKVVDELIEAIDIGADRLTVERLSAEAGLPEAGSLYGSAYLGSLDAAKALYDVLLPGCRQYSIETDPLCLCVKVAWWPDGLSARRCFVAKAWAEENAALAWLIAALMAFRKQESGK